MFDDTRKRWWALYVLCSGVLMIVLDTTIVNVALPSIREDLKFSQTSLACAGGAMKTLAQKTGGIYRVENGVAGGAAPRPGA